jgi:hypothetical protein
MSISGAEWLWENQTGPEATPFPPLPRGIGLQQQTDNTHLLLEEAARSQIHSP